MDLLDWPLGLRARPSRAHQDIIHTSTLSLLHTLVWKVTNVLKNQKTLASNQKQLAACCNVDHPEHPIILGLVSGSDSGLEGTPGFEVQSLHLRADPRSEDKENIAPSAGVARVEGGSSTIVAMVGDATTDDDDDDDDDGGEGDDRDND